MDLRDGWRYSGVRGELEFLVRQHFNGEVKYWREGPEVRRQLTEVIAEENEAVSADSGSMSRLDQLKARLEAWCSRGESPVKILFRRGFPKRLEL